MKKIAPLLVIALAILVGVAWPQGQNFGGGSVVASGGAANGATPVGNPVLIAGRDNAGNVQIPCYTNVGGNVSIQCLQSQTFIDAENNASGTCFVIATSGGCGTLASNDLIFNGTTWDRAVKCPTAVAIVVAAAGTQQVVAPVSGKLVRVCGLYLTVSTAGTLSITEGTGATCGTGTTTIFGQAVNLPTGGYPIITSPTSVMQTNVTGDGLCIVSGTAAVQGWAQVEQH